MALAIFVIIVYFNIKRARALIDDVAWICVHSKDAQQQLARTSLIKNHFKFSNSQRQF